MKYEIGEVKSTNKCIVQSKSAIYQLMDHEKFEEKSIQLNPTSLRFVSGEMNNRYLEMVFKDSGVKPSLEFTRYLQYYNLYTVVSLLILLLFFSFDYKQSNMPYAVFYIHLISTVFLITISIFFLSLIMHSDYFLIRNRWLYFAVVLCKLTYFIFMDSRVVCFFLSCQPDTSAYPLSLMIVIEFALARVVLFFSYILMVVLNFSAFLALVLCHFFLKKPEFGTINEVLVIFLAMLLITADCYTRDFRMKQIFWRAQKEDQAISNYKKISLSPIEPFSEFDILKTCEDLQKNLKYLSKVIIYKDSKAVAKDSVKQMHYIKEVIAKNPFYSEQIAFGEGLDQEDLDYITENFMEIYTVYPLENKPSCSVLPLEIDSEFSGILASVGRNWNFDVDTLNDSTGRSFTIVGEFLLKKWGLITELHLDELAYKKFLNRLEKTYKQNYFSNTLHATEVVHSLFCLIIETNLWPVLDHLQVLCLVIAGLGHDAGHPGVTSRYLAATQDPISLKFNDQSVLENMHCSVVFSLLVSQNSIFCHFSQLQWMKCRRFIIKMILSTDTSKHFEILSTFRSRAILINDLNLNIEDDCILIHSFALKCADFGFIGKSLNVHKKWMDLLFDEMYKQGELEKSQNLTISTYFNKELPNKCQAACVLIRHIALPMFEVFGEWLDNICKTVVLPQSQRNLEYWEKVRI